MEESDASVELVYLQTDCLNVTIKGVSSHPAFPGVEFTDKESSLFICCDDSCEVTLAGEQEASSLENQGRAFIANYQLRPLFFEQQRYEIIIEHKNGHKVEFWHENYNVRKNITPVGRRSDMVSGIINFGNEIGMSDLIVLVDGKSYLKLTIEVFPSKISYKDDYKAIVADVTAEVYNLVFDCLKKTYSSFDISSSKQSSPVEFFAIICKIYKEFLAAANMVIAKPHHILKTEYIVMPNHKVKHIDNKSVRWIEKHPEQTIRTGNKILVQKTLAVNKYVTYDTKENRLVKYMLQNTVKRLENFRIQYLKLDRETDHIMVNKIDDMIKGIQHRCNMGFLKDVTAVPTNSGMSLVFSMAPGYRELFRCYLRLQHGLSITGNIFNVSVKDLSVLYEYWCFLKLNSLMKKRYNLYSQDIIKITGNGPYVSLAKGQSSNVRYYNPQNGEKITLSYNPKKSSGATVRQKPDNVLKLKKKGSKVDYEYIFDAKYKINPAINGSSYQKMYNTPGPQEEDINTMHRYRDAIVYQSGASPYERTMFGAYVLFPYKNQEEYREHHFYKSIEQVNIGGLPFLPSATDLVTEMLEELISDSSESAFERATLPIGIEEHLAKVDWSKRDVLIGTLRDNDQLQACLENKFYYIPANLIKDKNLPIHYIALFQTPRIFPNKNGIFYWGEVLRNSIVARKSIHEVLQKHGSPDAPYYHFQIKEWKTLNKAISPKESAFIREFTNLFLLENVEFIPELLLRSEEEYRFYMELKRHTGTALENNSDTTGFELDDIKVHFADGQIQVYKDNKAVANCSVAEFSRWPNATFRRLQRHIIDSSKKVE